MTTLPTRLLLAVAFCGSIFLWLDDRYPGSDYWPALAIECLSLIVGIAVVDNLLSRHERQRWAAADAKISQRVTEFASNGLLSIANASQMHRTRLGEFMIANPAIASAQEAIQRLSELEIEPNVVQAARTFDATTRKSIASAVREIAALADGLTTMFGPRLEPSDVKSLITVSELCTRILSPFQAIPELLESNPSPNLAAQTELRALWDRFAQPAGADLKRLSETLRSLAAPKKGVVARATPALAKAVLGFGLGLVLVPTLLLAYTIITDSELNGFLFTITVFLFGLPGAVLIVVGTRRLRNR